MLLLWYQNKSCVLGPPFVLVTLNKKVARDSLSIFNLAGELQGRIPLPVDRPDPDVVQLQQKVHHGRVVSGDGVMQRCVPVFVLNISLSSNLHTQNNTKNANNKKNVLEAS